MRTSLLRIGGWLTGAVLLATVATGCQQASDVVASPPAIAAPTQSVEPPPTAAPTSAPISDPALQTVSTEPVAPTPVAITHSHDRGDQMFILTNDHPLAMYYFQASPISTDDWENDILGDSILMPGESTSININDDRQNCKYDFRAIFEDELTVEGYDVNICELSSYTFN